MIKVKENECSISGGRVPDILTDLTIATRGVYSMLKDNDIPEDKARQLIEATLHLALADTEQLKKKFIEAFFEED